jgi:multiple sugar transport system substrate-binding protein
LSNRRKWAALCLPAAMIAVAGCSGGEKPPEPSAAVQEKPPEPFKLTIYASGVKPEEFDTRFRSSLEKKFPHITFDYQTNTTGNAINNKVAQGDIPDIIRTDAPSMKASYLDLQLGYDLTELVKKNKYDLNRFVPSFIQDNIAAGQTGALYGLPVPPYFPAVLYYNIDLFDKFGVPYPKDGMSWDEIYDLSKRLSRVDGDKVIRGYTGALSAQLRDNVFSHPILDPSKDGLADHETWKKIFNNFLRFYSIPNNEIQNTPALESGLFAKGESAIHLGQHNIYYIVPPEVNWNIVSVPSMKDAPQRMGQRSPAYWSITRQSKYKDEAFQVILHMLSDEIQMEDSRQGITTTLVNKDIQNALGKGHPIYSTKNMKALLVYPPTDPTPKREAGKTDVGGSAQDNLLQQTFIKIAQNKTDLNTGIRELDELLKKEVEKERSK